MEDFFHCGGVRDDFGFLNPTGGVERAMIVADIGLPHALRETLAEPKIFDECLTISSPLFALLAPACRTRNRDGLSAS